MQPLIFMLFIIITLMPVPTWAVSVHNYIPEKAYPLLPVVKEEVERLDLSLIDYYMAAAIEKESCLSLTHKRCWSPESQLSMYWDKAKTRRSEVGVGLFMATKTWKKDGSVRFDTLTRLAKTYPNELKGLNWTTVKQRPDLQIRGLLLLMNETYSKLPTVSDVEARHAMTVSAYNSGHGRLTRDRMTCKLKKGCNPNLWFGNVEMVKAPGYATSKGLYSRTPWQINREHVKEVINIRSPKYKRWYDAH